MNKGLFYTTACTGFSLTEPKMPQVCTARERPDMMSASEGEGGHGKAEIERRLRELYTTNQFQMRTRGEGVKISKNLADIQLPLLT